MSVPVIKSRSFSGQRKNLIVVAGLVAVMLSVLLILQGQSLIVIGAVVVLALGVAILSWPEAATLVYALALYTNALVIASQFHGVPAILASGFTAILLIPLASYIMLERQPIISTPALPILGVYFLVMLVSALVSNNAAEAFEWIINFITEGLILYFLITNVLRKVDTIQRVTIVLLIAGSFVGALSIYQELTQTYDNNYGGFAQVQEGVFKVGENLFGSVEQRRLSGMVGEQNRFAQVMLVLVPLAYFQFRRAQTIVGKLLALSAAGLIIGGMLLTFSRGAMVALVIIVMI